MSHRLWLNLYNARLLHALREKRRSGHLFRHRSLFASSSYRAGANDYSLNQIEHGLLRCLVRDANWALATGRG